MPRPARVSDMRARQQAAQALSALNDLDAQVASLQRGAQGWLAQKSEKDGDVLTAFNAYHDSIRVLQDARDSLRRTYDRALHADVELDEDRAGEKPCNIEDAETKS